MVRIGPVVLHRGRERAILDAAVNEMLRASETLGGPNSIGLSCHVWGHRGPEDWHMLRMRAVMRYRGGNKALRGDVSKIPHRETRPTALACFLVDPIVLTLTGTWVVP